jgi:hypothetical protein
MLKIIKDRYTNNIILSTTVRMREVIQSGSNIFWIKLIYNSLSETFK